MADETTNTITRPEPKAPAKGIQVTDKALVRIRSAMAKEGISAEQGGLRLGVQDDVRVFVDPKSFIYLPGMSLDYQETLMQQGFVFVNPNSSKSCGCGSSFSA